MNMRVDQVKRIGIIGSGALGPTLAACAAPKYEVVLKRRSISNGLKEEAMQRVTRCFPGMVKRNFITEEQAEVAPSRVKITDNFNDLKDCQVVFDATPDILSVKVEGFQAANKVCSPDTVFMGTSACVSITSLASGSGRPANTMMAHFLTPVHIYTLCETVAALQTSPETIEFGEKFLKEGLGKTVVRVKDTAGLIQDYFLFAYFNHACRALDAGLGTAEGIDTIVKAGFGVKLGPFELMDHLGMASQIDSCNAIYSQTLDKSFAAHPLVVKMVAAGYCGRLSPSRKGWYIWDEKGNKTGINNLPL